MACAVQEFGSNTDGTLTELSGGPEGTYPLQGWARDPRLQGFEPRLVSNLLVMLYVISLLHLCSPTYGDIQSSESLFKSHRPHQVYY